MMKKRGLGRNLNALLGNTFNESAEEVAVKPDPQTINKSEEASINETMQRAPAQKTESGELRYVPIDLIRRSPYQAREEFDPVALEELADSIRVHGVMQPVVVRQAGGQYELIAGERRWRASQQAGLHEIPALIRQMDDYTVMAMGLIENLQRENLNAMEEAKAVHRLLTEFDLTHQQVADALGKSRTAITNLLRLMSLNESVKVMLENGDLEMGHARCLLSLDDNKQLEVAKMIVARNLSVRETERLVKQAQNQALPKMQKQSLLVDPNIQHVTNRLSEHLAAPVKVAHMKSGKGKVTINYSSSAELQGILDKILPRED